ncbi:hypothetical protein LLH23_15790 [bacterium]|nr:hypothetical protein [bacterium]
MNELPDVTTRKPGLTVLAIVLIVAATAVFAWLAYRGDLLQRQNAARVAQQTEASKALQRANQAQAAWRQTGAVATDLQHPVAIARNAKVLYVAGDRVVKALYLGHAWEFSLSLPGEPTALGADGKRLAVGLRDRVAVYSVEAIAGRQGLVQPQELQTPVVLGERAYVTGLAFVGNEIWVADAGNRRVHRMRNGRLVGDVGTPDRVSGYPGLIVPSPHLDLALLPSGDVLVNNPGRQRVEIWNRAGQPVRLFGQAAMSDEGFAGCCNPVAVAALPDGRIVTAEKGLVRVKVYQADGTFQSVVATPPVLARGEDGLDVATTAEGQILVLDPRARAILTFAENTAPQAQGSH